VMDQGVLFSMPLQHAELALRLLHQVRRQADSGDSELSLSL
jgi:hypothetical protein